MVDKSYCMSSYLSLRYVEDDNRQFFDNLNHQVYKQPPLDRKVFVSDAHDVDIALRNVFRRIAKEKLGMLLSGGMDSSILASYMPEGADAYTFRFLGGRYQADELERAEYYAKYYHLNIHSSSFALLINSRRICIKCLLIITSYKCRRESLIITI